MRKCIICKIEKPLAEYNKKKNRKDGLQQHCRECNRLHSRQYYKNNKEKHLKTIKLKNNFRRRSVQKFLCEYLANKQCVICAEKDILVLEFDHLRDKFSDVCSLASNHSLKKVCAEIIKCQILCRNCHARKTHKDNNSYKYKWVLSSA